MTDPSIFAMVCEQRDNLAEKLAKTEGALEDALKASIAGSPTQVRLIDLMRARYGRETEQWKANHAQRKQERDELALECDALRRENASLRESLDALARQAQDASDGLAARRLAIGIRAVLAYVRLHERHTYAPDEMPRVNAVRAWLVENGARLHGDEAVYAAAEAHGTAVRR